MKYYIYISDTKVDMLYPQIPKSILKKVASSLSIDLKLLGVELSVAGKSNASDETRYAKVKIVSEYIEKHLDVGGINAPSTYFKGSLPMKWSPLRDQIVYFSGVTSHKTFIGLGGSLKHVIGADGGLSSSGLRFPSTTREILMTLVETIENSDSQSKMNTSIRENISLIDLVIRVERAGRGPKQRVEFLAKTLLQDSHSDSYAVLGTPIYVALAD